jgi:NADH-quinone oxidoreductase subunit N
MFLHNGLIGFQKGILSLAVYIISLVCADWFRNSEHMPESFVLMLSALLGMFFLLSSDNLLMFYLSLELSSIPVAAMANFDLERKKSSEAAMKMVMSSALASGIMLFGISLLYGLTGSLDFSQMWGLVKAEPVYILGFVFLFAAFAFKLSVVPFHLWTADVYQGSPVPVTAFLSVVSKGAVTFALVMALGKLFQNLSAAWYALVVALSVITMLVGNFFAIRQDNLLRFLAFSSIAQVGFILVGISGQGAAAQSSTTYFVLVYVFSNLAAFGVASVLRTQAGIESISQLKGLYKVSPLLAWTLSLGLFSLAGIPPVAGFFGKLFLLMSGASKGNYVFIGIAAVNMIISLYYYLRVVRLVFSAPEGETAKVEVSRPVQFGLAICALGIVLAGVVSWVYDHISSLV